jgi:hypothetical protein
MSVLDLLDWLQGTISQLIAESTWGYPIVGALHVLAMALCGGAVILTDLRALGWAFPREDASQLDRDVRWVKRTGLAMVVATGLLLFASQPVRYYGSASFRIKLVLLALIVVNASISRRSAWISLALWAAVIVAARGIAFF